MTLGGVEVQQADHVPGGTAAASPPCEPLRRLARATALASDWDALADATIRCLHELGARAGCRVLWSADIAPHGEHPMPPPQPAAPDTDAVAIETGHQVVGSIHLIAPHAVRPWLPAIAAITGAGAGRLLAQRRQQASDANLKAILDTSYDGIVSFGLDGRIRSFNAAAEWMFGVAASEMLGLQFPDTLFTPAACRPILESMASYRHNGVFPLLGRRHELEARRAGGAEFPVELIVTVRPQPDPVFSAFIRDVTERRRLETELRYAQKLEAVGQLAAGVAHEINTPIQFVGDNVHFLGESFQALCGLLATYDVWHRDGLPDEAVRAAVIEQADWEYLETEIPKALEQTREGIARVASIVRALKEFAHPGTQEQGPTDLNRTIRNTITVAFNQVKEVADVTTDLGELPLVRCHANDMGQVLLNLIVNAVHAIEDRRRTMSHRGRIAITSRVEGTMAVVTVSDDGCGIPLAVQPRVFDPMFTTKEQGRGTGQGLALSQSIVVEKHRGSIAFTTREGEGTTFVVSIPIDGVERSASGGRS